MTVSDGVSPSPKGGGDPAYYSVALVNVKAILHSAAIVKIIFHPHMDYKGHIARGPFLVSSPALFPLFLSGEFRGGEPGPPPLGDGLTPSLAVMLANAKF